MKKVFTIIFLVIVLVVFGYFLSGSGSFTYETPSSNLSEKMNLSSVKLATLPNPGTVTDQNIYVSPGGKIAIYTGQNIETRKYYFGVNDKVFDSFDKIGTPVFNSLGSEGFIVSESGPNKTLHYIASGKIRTISDSASNSSVNVASFSPDGKRFAYISGFERRKTLNIGNEQYGPYENVSLPIFSPNSQKIAFIAEQNKKMFLVSGGVEGKSYEFVSAPTWSGDSSTFSYIAVSKMDPAGSNNECFVVYGGVERELSCGDKNFLLGLLYHVIAPVMNFDGSKITYPEVASPGKYSKSSTIVPVKIRLVSDGKFTKSYDLIANPEYFRSSGELSFISAEGDIARFVSGDSIGKSYSEISDLSRASNGVSAYGAVRFSEKSSVGQDWVVVFDGKEFGTFDGVTDVSLNDDGSKVAYIAFKFKKTGESSVKEYFAGIGNKRSESLIFASGLSWEKSGTKLAFVGRGNGGETVYVNMSPQKKYDQIFSIPKWSDDGKHLGYGARIGNDVWWIVDEVK